MNERRLATAVIGFGKIGAGYADDDLMARHYRYATHAQVLADHRAFDWLAVVDPNPDMLVSARDRWNVPHVAKSVEELGPCRERIEVAVLATPPQARLDLLGRFPALRAVLVEKPLGVDAVSGRAFLDECRRRGILVQVNLWRRADQGFRQLATELQNLIGSAYSACFFYGNGLLNNGTHMIDFARMLFGEVESVQRIGASEPFIAGPIPGDLNPAFALRFESGLGVVFTPLHFSAYRENGAIIFGSQGRLDILNEGLTIQHFRRCPNRAMRGEYELPADGPVALASTVGSALYEMYSNLFDAVDGGTPLFSPGESALVTSEVVEAVLRAPASGELRAIRNVLGYGA
jgi:predicted dehydrogenase